jgi:hypothetical protein
MLFNSEALQRTGSGSTVRRLAAAAVTRAQRAARALSQHRKTTICSFAPRLACCRAAGSLFARSAQFVSLRLCVAYTQVSLARSHACAHARLRRRARPLRGAHSVRGRLAAPAPPASASSSSSSMSCRGAAHNAT